MRMRFWLAALITALVLPAAAVAGNDLTPNDVFANPDKHFELDGLKQLKKSKKIFLPSITLQLLVAGDMFAVGNAGGNTAQAKMKYATLGLDKAFAQKMAQDAYNDLAAKMTAAGYEVITWDMVKDREDVKKLERLAPGKDGGLPQESPRGFANTYLIVTPSDDQAIKPAFQGLGWTWRKITKDLDATMIDATYMMDAPQVWSDTEKGYKRVNVSVNSAPGMTMASARILMFTAKGGWGSMTSKSYTVGFAENVGTLSKVEDNSPTAANALSAALGILGGVGKIDRKSGIYVFQVDQPAYAAAVAKATGAVHTLWGQATAEYAK